MRNFIVKTTFNNNSYQLDGNDILSALDEFIDTSHVPRDQIISIEDMDRL